MADSAKLPGVLLLSQDSTLSSIDRHSLRQIGVAEITSMTSGAEAARWLADENNLPVSSEIIVVCSETLADMSGEKFCDIVRLHPRLLALPVLLILSSDSELAQLKALGCGASAMLVRPYSLNVLRQALQELKVTDAAARPKRGGETAGTHDFDKALETFASNWQQTYSAENHLRAGMRYLHEGKWNNALQAFKQALTNETIRAEAELGLALAWHGKSDERQFCHWLACAAKTFIRVRNWQRARTAYARLMQANPEARDPYFSQARRLIRRNRYSAAAETLAERLQISNERGICEDFAKICLVADSPEVMLDFLLEMLESVLGEDSLSVRAELRAAYEAEKHRLELFRLQSSRERQASLARRFSPSAATIAKQEKETPSPHAEATASVATKDGKSAGGMPSADSKDDADDAPKALHAILPMTPEEIGVDPMTNAPSSRLNDLFAVVRHTWKLGRKKR
ncbi:MAG: hypothetical protein K6F46_08395 [Desulfovibrio sp.]|nr:hypothetical protein [Desulfovibrio sp.]